MERIVTVEDDKGGDLKADIIDGIGGFVAFTGWSARRCYHCLEQGYIPATKIGGKWVGSKRAVRERFSRVTNGKASL